MSISFTDRVVLPEDVLVSDLQGESVILNLNNKCYYGLDEIGTSMLSVLTTSHSIEAAFETLLNNYDVSGEVLRRDLISLIERLVDQGVVEITRA
ncbi:MAG: PqqD family peptide modification chaperone [Pyrinomonadaceae bacterium]